MPEELSPLGFPTLACNPRMDGDGRFAAYQCCSSDPAAPNGTLPAYQGKNIPNGGTPFFSGANNALSTWGVCVDTTAIPNGAGLLEPVAQNCPIPCNPTWEAESVDAVCGSGRACCQATELQMADCVQDADGTWRAVTGADVGALTDWAPTAHATHQDPAGTGCLALAGGDANSDVFADCIAQLGAADQRGFCMALGTDGVCPGELPSYVDACELLNQ